MPEPTRERLNDVHSTVQTGFRVHARNEGRTQSVQLADDLSGIHNQISEIEMPTAEETANTRSFFSSVDRNLQRTRKTVEVVEDSLDIGLGHSKLARIAMSGAQLNSMVALAVASHNLLMSANKLDRAHQAAGSIQEIAAGRFHEFYRAIGIVAVEAILFTTPFNYQIAWKGTRFLNNKFLYTLRHSRFSGAVDDLLKDLHRLILSESHYAIRGIVPAALRTPEELVNYLTSMATQTLDIIWEFSNMDLEEIQSEARGVVDEYVEFVENTYAVVTPEIGIDQVLTQVTTHLAGDTDLFSIPEPNLSPTF